MKRLTARMKVRRLIIALALATTVTPALAEQPAAPAKSTDTSQMDTARVVAIGGDITEIIYALGMQDRLVAVDATSQFPPEALKEKQSVGYMRALSSEGVLATNPTTILVSETAGPPEVLSALKSGSVPLVEITDENSIDGIYRKIKQVGSVFSLDDKAEVLIQKLKSDFARLEKRRSRMNAPVRTLFVLAASNGRAIVGGANTSADTILTLAGAENVAKSVQGFKPLADEALIEMAPEAIVIMNRGDESRTYKKLKQLAGLRLTPAGKNERFIVMDGLYLLGFGPRTPQAAADLMDQLISAPSKAQAGSLN